MSDFWQETITTAKLLRQDLHTHPELPWHEFRTAECVRKTLTQLNIPWRVCAKTGTVALLGSATPQSPHIALRGDIDALPIHEQSGATWTSKTEGCMHACGHDGHTATLLATARWLKHREHRLPGQVSLLFQPAEEGGHGAREMINDGALENIDEIFGWHNWPAIPFGKLLCPDGLVMCGNGVFSITVNGQGGHASQPELCVDPVLTASAITMALQQIVSRRLPPQQAAVVSVTSIDAISGATIIPQSAVISGSIRVPNLQVRQTVNQLIEEIATHVAASYGASCDIEISPRYEATINHAAQASKVRQAWGELFGKQSLDHQALCPVMASEDFSYYLNEIPGAFALIGTDDGPAHQPPCHSPHYDFNDHLIPMVTQLYTYLVGGEQPNNQ